jgi:hypothetical protein
VMIRISKIVDGLSLTAIFLASLALHDNPWSGQLVVLLGAFATMAAARVALMVRNNSRLNLLYFCLSVVAGAVLVLMHTFEKMPGKLDFLILDQALWLVLLIIAGGLVFYALGQTALNLTRKSKRNEQLIYVLSYGLGALSLLPTLKLGEKLDLFRPASPDSYVPVVLSLTIFGLIVRWIGSIVAGRRIAKADWAPIVGYFLTMGLIL